MAAAAGMLAASVGWAPGARAEPDTDGPATHLDVVTFNMQAPRGADADAAVELIARFDADVVALQELSTDAASRIEARLADDYPFMALHPRDDSVRGQGVLSRYPITGDRYVGRGALPESLGHQRATVNVGGQQVTVVNVHLRPMFGNPGVSPESRRRAIERLLARTRSVSGPLIVLGDFNLMDSSTAYERMAGRLTDAFGAAGHGPGHTYPASPVFPALVRIDYIFVDEAFRPLGSRVLESSGGSDHYPLRARLALRAP